MLRLYLLPDETRGRGSALNIDSLPLLPIALRKADLVFHLLLECVVVYVPHVHGHGNAVVEYKDLHGCC